MPMLPHEPERDIPTAETNADSTTAAPTGSPAPSARGLGPLTVGQALGPRYRILALLGRGGMGAVYKAWDEELGLAVALKTIAPAPGADEHTTILLARRFKREALLARQITHRNVVRVHDVGEIDGVKFLTMAFVEGETLSELMRRRGRLDPPEVIQLARQVADGLSAAHDAGVVHRDLKPANVMITPGGEACIMDFGIARSANTTVTQSGVVVGTLEYMAPEQLHGDTDERTDVYALGLIAYDMLLGRHRLEGVDQPMLEALARSQRPLPAVSSRQPEVPSPLATIVDRAIRPRPDERFPSARALLDALGTLAADGHLRRDLVVEPEPRPDIKSPDAQRRKPLLRAAMVAAIVALVATGGWIWRGLDEGSPATPPGPLSVVVAEFANRTGDAAFDGLLDQAMTIGLEGASFINVYPRREALRHAAQLKTLNLDLQTSRLIGLREGIPLVVSGGIDTSGTGYRLSVEVHQAGTDGTRVFDWSTTASNRDDVLEEVGRLAVQVRRALGDGTVDVQSVSPSETFTAASIEAAAEYVRGQELLAAGNRQEAFAAYERAVTLDPNLGRAWAGMGTVAYNQRRLEDAERYLRTALGHVDRMTEREQLRTRVTYYDVTGNAEEARAQGETLVAKFPSDAAGLSNLALAHFKAWHFARALELGQQAAALFPKNVLRQSNVALYALYASDFEGAARQVALVQGLSPDYPYAQLTSALIDVAAGRWDEATAGYTRLGTLATPGPSLSVHGRADLARHRGRLKDAETVLATALATADAASRSRLVASLAAVRAARSNRAGALDLLAGLPPDTPEPGALVEAGETYLALGLRAQATALLRRVEGRLGIQGDIFASVLRAQMALAEGRPRESVAMLLDTRRKADAWLVRYWLGRSYVALGAFAEADAEFEACLRRRGEALAVFLDDFPTYHRLADVYYYQGLARTGLKSPAALESFKAFVAIKDAGDETGGLVADARERLASSR